MSKTCKDCQFYNTGIKRSGMCKNLRAEDFGRLVWPSKAACSVYNVDKPSSHPLNQELTAKRMTS